MKHFLPGVVLLIIMGCHASQAPRGTSACNSVANILGNPLACEGSDLVVPGHLTFTGNWESSSVLAEQFQAKRRGGVRPLGFAATHASATR